MIDARFKKIVRSGTGCAVILAGSDSDRPHIEKIARALKKYAIPHRAHICSAHKQPGRLMEIVAAYNTLEGSAAFVAVAGGTDALSGTLSWHAMGPVISCPPDAPNESCLTNPPGSSNAVIEHPSNAARFIAQLYAGVNPTFRERLEKEMARKIASLQKADERYRAGKAGKRPAAGRTPSRR
jgi:5-(carboxyamino)imidazole ribonucleotide mutase